MANDPRRPRRPRRPRQPVSDIERFLQEVDRLRRKAHEEAQQGPAEYEVQEVLPAEPSRRRAEETIDEVVVLPDDAPPPPVRRRHVEAPRPVARYVPAPQPLPQAAPAATPPTARRRNVSSAAPLLLNMLRSRENLKASILVREILDPPLCKRRRNLP